MQEFIDIIINLSSELWYTWLFILMALESSLIPLPSELVIIPAWYLSSIWEMNFFIAWISSLLWVLVWSTINYYLWKHYWKKIIHKLVKKYWKYILFSIDHYEKSEKYFERHWSITTFIGRFIPAIRQFISIPAWIFNMNMGKFLLYTWIWAGIWNFLLLMIWYIAWENKELIALYSYEILIISLISILIIGIIYYYLHKKKYAKL